MENQSNNLDRTVNHNDDISRRESMYITDWNAVEIVSDECFIKEAVNIINTNDLLDADNIQQELSNSHRKRSNSLDSSASESTNSGSYWSCILSDEEGDVDNEIFDHETTRQVFTASEEINTEIFDHNHEKTSQEFTVSGDIDFINEKNQNLKIGQEYDIISTNKVNDQKADHNEVKPECNGQHDLNEAIEDSSLSINIIPEDRNLNKSENRTQESTKSLSTIDEQTDGSTFKRFHSRIAGNLQDKLKYHEYAPKVRSISVIEGIYHRKLDQKLADCLNAYDIIDKFDVKVSEKEVGFTKSDSFNPFRSLRRSFNTKKSYNVAQNSKTPIVPASAHKQHQLNGIEKASSWPQSKAEVISTKENLDVHITTIKAEDGEMVQVISLSPRFKEKGLPNTESIEIPRELGQDEIDNKDSFIVDNDIGILDNGETDSGSIGKGKLSSKLIPMISVDNCEDGIEPIPPPRRRKAKASESETMTQATDQIPRCDSWSAIGQQRNLDPEAKRKSWTLGSGKPVSPNLENIQLGTDRYPVTFVDSPHDRRSLIALEMYTTERSYVRGLEVIVKLFKRRLSLADWMDVKEIDLIFSNVNDILDFNGELLETLYSRIEKWSDEQKIGDIFLQDTARWNIYATYCQNYDASEAYIKQKMKKKKEFGNLLNICYSNPVGRTGLTLPSYLITIVQRIPRYIMLLKDLVRKTVPNHPDLRDLGEALRVMEKVASYINEQLKQSQSKKALAALQSQIIGLKAYYIPGRTLIHEGPVCLSNIKKTYQCVLFNDLLVFAVKGTNRQSEVELVLDLNVVWCEDLKDLDPQTTKQDAIALYTPDRPYSIYVGTNSEKKLWLQHLKKTIALHLGHNENPEKADLSRRSASHTFKDGAVYSGDFIDSMRHGEGTMMWPNQMTYRGQWFDNERNGQGVLEYGTGEIYEGEWKDDQQHGSGKLKYNNNDEYVGEWKLGIRHGKGSILFQNGDLFDGYFAYDRIEGEGKLTCMHGMEYSGMWKKNMKHGSGTQLLSNGDEYKGEFRCDKFHDHGELIYKNGDIYCGDFENGELHGNGIFKEMNGIVYDGSWMHDCKDGHGKLTYLNGDTYEGTFIQDKKFGNGKMTYNKGDSYHGQWENNLISGQGEMKYKDGSQYNGEWEQGAKHGNGTMKYWNGSVYEGGWKYDLVHGHGSLTKSSGWKYHGDWLHGKQHGKGTLTDQTNCYKYQGDWKNGNKTGRGIEMVHGFLYEGQFKDDKRHGNGTETAPDTTTFEGYWQRGQKNGKGIRRLPNGMIHPQMWMIGCLMDCPVVVAREVPALERN